jgi:hypothetical protein
MDVLIFFYILILVDIRKVAEAGPLCNLLDSEAGSISIVGETLMGMWARHCYLFSFLKGGLIFFFIFYFSERSRKQKNRRYKSLTARQRGTTMGLIEDMFKRGVASASLYGFEFLALFFFPFFFFCGKKKKGLCLFLDFGLGMNGDFFFFFLFKKKGRERGELGVRNQGGSLVRDWTGPCFLPHFVCA